MLSGRMGRCERTAQLQTAGPTSAGQYTGPNDRPETAHTASLGATCRDLSRAVPDHRTLDVFVGLTQRLAVRPQV